MDNIFNNKNKISILRPKYFKNYIGQKKIKNKLKICIEATKQRNDILEHILLYGPPGLGKTTLSYVIANEFNTHIQSISGTVINKPGEIVAILNNLNNKDILFIDEIHRLNHAVEEILCLAMEDYSVNITIGDVPSVRTIKLNLPKFTLIGATTNLNLLSAPFRNRFNMICHLDYYTKYELRDIILNSSNILNIKIDEISAYEISKRSRGTPRTANNLLKTVRNYAQIKYGNNITKKNINVIMNILDIDKYGLNKIDRLLLKIIIKCFSGGPVGINSISTVIGENPNTIINIYEPYLIKNGFIIRTSKGRIASKLAYFHLGYKFNKLKYKLVKI